MNVSRSHEKAKNRQDSAETLTDTEYIDDLSFLANTPAQAEFLLHRLEKTARGIVVYMNLDKKKSSCVLIKMVSLNGNPLKLLHQFTYLCSNISYTKRDINIPISKA